MAKPKGWTDPQVKHRDKIADKLIQRGYGDSQAYAIATNIINNQKRKGEKLLCLK